MVGNAGGGSIAGLTLRYEHLGGFRYKVIWDEFIDCKHWSGQPTVVALWAGCRQELEIQGGGTRFLPQMPVQMDDYTPLCESVHSACDSDTVGAAGYGIVRLHTVFVVDLDSVQRTGCCWTRIYAAVFSRNILPVANLKDVGAGLYTYIDLNLCDTPTGKGPVWQAPGIPFFCVGDTVEYDPLIEDPDGDSLYFRLVTPLASLQNGRPSSMLYAAGYSARNPLKYAGYPNPDWPPPMGFHFDSTTGRFVFIPTEAMVAQIAFDIEEYRNGRLLSVTRVDYQFWMLNCGNRRPHVSGIDGKDVTRGTVCEESTICFNVYSWDYDTMDSLTMWMEGNVPGASFMVYPPPDSAQRKRIGGPKGRFCWTPPEGTARPFPYRFAIRVRDDACPAYGERRQVFEVQVKPLPLTVPRMEYLRCGRYRLWHRLLHGDSPVFQTWRVYGGGINDSPWVFYDDTVLLSLDVGRRWHSYRLSVMANGCVRDYEDSFFVPSFSRPSLSVFRKGRWCPGDTLHLGLRHSLVKGVRWFLAGRGTYLHAGFDSALYVGGDTANVWVVYWGDDTCAVDTFRETFVASPKPRLDFEVSPSSGCRPMGVLFKSRSWIPSGRIHLLVWLFDDGLKVWNQTEVFRWYDTVGGIDLSLWAMSDVGCVATRRWDDVVRVHPVPHADFMAVPEKAIWPKRRIWFINKSTGVDTHAGGYSVWNFGDPRLLEGGWDTAWNTSHRYNDSGSFRVGLWIGNRWGCKDSAFQEVWVGPGARVYAPNAFSPDGDGLNDHFRVSASGFSAFRLLIYNRWGRLIYESTDYATHGWDGTVDGIPAPADVYMWEVVVLDHEGKQHQVSGMVHLVR